MLILGNPGAGKTTTTLDLAKALISRAEKKADYPIPVLFNLSNWKNDRQLIHDWLVAELKSKYGVRKDISSKWLDNAKLLPMLDGLDELESARQEPCVRKMNEFLQSDYRPKYLLVCSRWEEYANYSERLQLNGAIFLRLLSYHQIKNYLANLNRTQLWQFLQTDTTLL
ncbi:MAG: NACHT domain-containing protein [Nostoc sp. ChiSLP02]|nr:NACHT domain-containing protein [Nostoc sp. DedSLP05]MDZ8102345.1 NACHT domain-containing protein [Nostoc sp. DedSLP01]MDZ8188420.1 NACHT domain-containing protein [Nostoc sp. ChiSLP02]